MSDFISLTQTLEDWFDKPHCDLPDEVQQRVEHDFPPIPWDDLTASQRRSASEQWDYQNDPATEQDRAFWWDFYSRKNDITRQISEWETVATPAASDLAQQEVRLAELRNELADMTKQERQAQKQAPEQYRLAKSIEPQTSGMPVSYLAYPKAIGLLIERLQTTPEELAAWIWMGPEHSGIAAYLNVNEITPPPRFYFGAARDNDFDYISPMMASWFREEDISNFQPIDRYITGKALIERWSTQPHIQPEAFIRAKIAESRLLDGHPLFGGTQGSFPADDWYPPLEGGLFLLAHIEAIEAEDFALPGKAQESDSQLTPMTGSPEWRKQTAKAAANAKHNKAGGSRDKHQQIRAIWATGKYTSRDICAEQECAGLDMSFKAARNALINTPEPRTPPRC